MKKNLKKDAAKQWKKRQKNEKREKVKQQQ